MIRILCLIDEIGPTAGGTEKQLVATLERLDRRRFEPHLVFLRGANRPANLTLPCPTDTLNFTYFGRLDFWRAGRRLREICGDRNIDLVHTFLLDSNLFGAFWGRWAKVPVIASRRSIGADYWYTIRHRNALRILSRITTHYVANSRAAAEAAMRIERLPPDRVTTIPNGIDVSRRTPLDEETIGSIKAGWGLPADAVVVGALANLRPIKNLEFLVEAAADVLGDAPGAAVVVLGEGPQRRSLEARVAARGLGRRFVLPGFTSDPERDVQAFDVGVLVSRSESSSNAVLECMVAGKPSVVSRVGGSEELISHGESGYLFDLGDRNGFTGALSRLLRDADLRRRIGAEARRVAVSRHDWGVVMPQLEELYASVAARSQRRS